LGPLALAVPAGTPRTIIDKIAADSSRIITRPDFSENSLPASA